jgi:peptidoglycan/xylan/chitin deacetylase (PgdA/CDA1 family)
MRKALLAVAIVAPAAAILLYRFGLVAALAPIFISHLLLLYAALAPNCTWLGPVVRSFRTDQPEVWLTIDDGPCAAQTNQILDLLDQYDARATFFVIGDNAEKAPHLVTEILVRGHEVANHTFTHPSRTFWAAGPRMTAREIDYCATALRSTAERPARWFRAPAGLKNIFLHPMLRQRGLQLVGWSIRSLDTVRRDAETIAKSIAKRAHPGAIILLHEGHRLERDPTFNTRCVELTLKALADAGYRCVIPLPQQFELIGAGK